MKRVKNLRFCIDLERKDITLIGFSHKARKQRQFIKILVKHLLTQLSKVIMDVYSLMERQVVVKLTP